MENMTNLRRLKIIAIYIVIFSAVAFLIYFLSSADPTCSDNIKNQGEKEIDCGGPCSPCKNVSETKDLFVQEAAFLADENGTYDVVAKVTNLNNSVGAGSFKYVFTLKNESGEVIATSEDTGFILPADTRYIAKLGLVTENNAVPASVEFAASDIQWGILEGIAKPQIGIYGKKFGADPSGVGSKVEGILRNESIYDLKKIEAVIVLRNERGDVVGINTTQRDSVRAKEQQNFQVTWPKSLGNNIQKIEIDPQTNVFDSQNFSVSI